MSGFGRILDRAAIGLSSLCLVHCLATPMLLLLLPAASLSLVLPEAFHIWMLSAAIPISILALRSGHRHHRQWLPMLGAATGLGLLGIGALFIANSRIELVITVAGAICLAGAHVWNARLAARKVPN